MKARPESKLVTEDPEIAASKSEKPNQTGNKKTKKQPDSKLVTEDPDSETDKAERQNGAGRKKTEASAKTKTVAGGSPSAGAVKGDTKHQDDSKEGSEKLKKDAVIKSEQQNFNQKKGYNEVPRSVPVKSIREKV